MKTGTVVRHPAYGRMTVERVEDEKTWQGVNRVACCWWDGSRFLRAHFMPDELELEQGGEVPGDNP